MEDVCEAPLCAGDDDELNDLFDEPTELGELDDTANPLTFMSILSEDEDVDIYSWTCNDTLTGIVQPSIVTTTDTPFRTCLFLDCRQGGNPIFDCPDGTTEDTAPIGFLPGCCSDDASPIDLTAFNCPDSSDETVFAYFRADMGPANVCLDYSVDYDC